MMKRFLIYVLALSLVLLSSELTAQRKKKKQQEEPPKKEKKDEKTLADVVKKSIRINGLFTFYRDSTNGSMKMLIKPDQIGKEFIHFYYIENGVAEAGSFRGNFRGTRIFRVEKYYNRIELRQQNSSSYFDEKNPVSRAANANLSEGILLSGKIEVGSEEEGGYLIDADELFLSESFGFVKAPPRVTPRPNAFSVGSLSKSKTKYKDVRNYPENSDVIVEYAYENKAPKNFGSRAVTDARNVLMTVQHSIIAVPENDYEPRFDDARVGYFNFQVSDMTSMSATPYRDLIHRWNLKKKDPEAELSEPVEPIVYWVENTTPLEIRDIIVAAGLTWNEAFEAAGFKNAIQMKIQPDDAEWDAGDIRYNVLRWTSSPTRLFGGYGPHFSNPRTGQIMGADIMLEYASLGGNLRGDKVFSKAALDIFELDENSRIEDPYFCSAADYAQLNNLFGQYSLDVLNPDEYEKNKLLKEFVYFLTLHEMGHTLGLNHNMKATQIHDLEDIQNEELTSEKGLYGSVMDYPSINFSFDRDNQGQYWTTKPGPYDKWAIEFGYSEVDGTGLKTILNKSTQSDLVFGNDADDMRSPGKAIDPRVNVGDMTSSAIDYAIERMQLTQIVSKELLEKYKKDSGRSYHELRNAYFTVTGQHAGSANTISRYVGGVYLDRAMIGQDGATQPFTPVDAETQKRAMVALSTYVFAPNSFNYPSDLYAHLQMQRRGFNHFGTTEDPKIHLRVVRIQMNVLRHLLHPNTLQRISDSELYGNGYSLSTMMTDLKNALFQADNGKSVNSHRQNIQTEYTKMLAAMLNPVSGQSNMAKSMALYNLQSINKMSKTEGNLATRAHRQHLSFIIDEALNK
ncbi:MAG: DUF5117 domain-containing protein [Cytophagales bacterium]|nr:DUF5117 domain-containing protein [Cytophagales bacterium]